MSDTPWTDTRLDADTDQAEQSPEPLHREIVERELLPVEASFEQQGPQSLLRIPLRAERVWLEKRTVVAERAVIRRQRSEGIATLGADVRREELRVEPIGDVETTRPIDPQMDVVARPGDQERAPRRDW